ncbi:MAG: hypothetical protein IPH82_02680 [Chloroflexi bacterium]|nr:hypothetical protein [Chloroflexota bacterium]
MPAIAPSCPGGLGSISFVSDFGVAPKAMSSSRQCGGWLLPAGSYAFRSSNGTITQQQPTASGFSHPSQLTSDGRWLAQQSVDTFPNHNDTYQLTNGTTATPVFSFANSSGFLRHSYRLPTTPNTNGVVAITIKRPPFLRRRTLRHRTGHNPRLGD